MTITRPKLDDSSMLTDTHIYAASVLLSEQFPHNIIMSGLQTPVLETVLQFNVASSTFVQVLHDGDVHWVVVASPPADIAADLITYDSLYESRAGSNYVIVIVIDYANVIGRQCTCFYNSRQVSHLCFSCHRKCACFPGGRWDCGGEESVFILKRRHEI